MTSAVVDSSVLLAVLRQEPRAEEFLDDIDHAIVSTVNLVEVASRLMLQGLSEADAWRDAMRVSDDVVSFDELQARAAAEMIKQTNRYGLSLGDRACLALGLVRGLPVYTADRAWRDVAVGVEVHLVR